ncbi:MAG: hypothetical protein Metus_0460 [Candidatus Methanosuratincola subterraneus]|uniref:Uncharacterized protein n=1 Tax=Methanosuratincola subterraneus TaxID=2593994 RepID=A0A444L7V6_METS7|nr:MAG: hypothetical protein Metus_0460 [Candidatus Methanosuratincola subterraneus]
MAGEAARRGKGPEEMNCRRKRVGSANDQERKTLEITMSRFLILFAQGRSLKAFPEPQRAL